MGGGFPSLDPEALDDEDLKEVKETLQHVTNVLLHTRVTLYAVDPTSLAPGMTEITDASQMAFVLAAGDSLAHNSDPLNATEDFDQLGPVTGGRVVRGRNDIARQIAASVDLGDRFYTLSYTPSSSSDAAVQYRRIRVDCLRRVLSATRAGYYSGQTAQEKSAATVTYDLTTAAESSIPLTDSALPSNPIPHPTRPPKLHRPCRRRQPHLEAQARRQRHRLGLYHGRLARRQAQDARPHATGYDRHRPARRRPPRCCPHR